MKRRSFLKILGIAPVVPVLLNTKDVGGTVMEERRQGLRREEEMDVGSRSYLDVGTGQEGIMVGSSNIEFFTKGFIFKQ